MEIGIRNDIPVFKRNWSDTDPAVVVSAPLNDRKSVSYESDLLFRLRSTTSLILDNILADIICQYSILLVKIVVERSRNDNFY
jgi:hypothetical protein